MDKSTSYRTSFALFNLATQKPIGHGPIFRERLEMIDAMS